MGCNQIENKKRQEPQGGGDQISKSKGGNPNPAQNKVEEVERHEEHKQVKASITLERKEPELVKISIPVNSNKKWEKSYPKDSKINDIVADFKKENKEDFCVENDIQWKINESPMNLEAKLESMIPKDDNNVNLNIEYEIFGLKNIPSEINRNVDLVAKPLSNPFELFIFHTKDKIFQTKEYDESIISSYQLGYFSGFSAYCNGNNMLFLSGGQNKQEIPLGHFWTIDLNNPENIEKHPSGMEPKKLHSMIYIPYNYVFIVGGNTEDTFYYDINSKSFNNWAEMNNKRLEPALAIVNNRYIYAFDNIKINQQKSLINFERTDLRKSPMWEIITPEIDQGVQIQNFKQKFFGLCHLDNESMIFLGGNMDKSEGIVDSNPECFIYNSRTNTMSPGGLPFQEFDLSEKTFYPLSATSSFIIPYCSRTNPKIIIFNQRKNKCSHIHFEANTENTPGMVNEYLDDNMLESIKLSQSNIKNMARRKYDFNMPNFNFEKQFNNEEVKIEPAKGGINLRATPQHPSAFMEVSNKPQPPEKGQAQDYANNVIIDTPNNAPGDLAWSRVEPSEDLKKRYNYGYNEDIPKVDLLKQQEAPEKVIVEKVQEPEFEQKQPIGIGETYINDNHEEPIPVRNQKQYDLKNSGTLLRSSIIKNNNRSMIKKSGLPTVNRSYIPKTNKVIMSKDFNNDGGELKASINVGLGGRKTGSRIVQ